MVFWVVCDDHLADGPRSFGPYESAAVAERALAELRRRFLTGAARRFRVVLDYV